MTIVIIAYYQIISGKLTLYTNVFTGALSFFIELGEVKTSFVFWNVLIYKVSVIANYTFELFAN